MTRKYFRYMTSKYQNSKIYAIRNHINDEVYIGSTSSELCKRMVKHRCTAKQEPTKSPFHFYMNENGIENFYIELVEVYPCENIEQLRKREGEIIREQGSLNKQIAGRPKEEYKAEYSKNNRDKINQQRNERRHANPEKTRAEYRRYGAQYRERHPERIKAWHTTKVDCKCGGKYTLSHKAEHFRSQRHQNYLNNNIDHVEIQEDEHEVKD